MVTVAARELKNRLGKYLDLVRHGEPVRITDRGRPVGCIIPETTKGPEQGVLERLLAGGALRLGTGRLDLGFRPARLGPGKSIEQMLDEERR